MEFSPFDIHHIYILFITVPSKIANGHTSPELLQQTLTDALEKKTALGKR